MAKPTDLLTWATDATYGTGPGPVLGFPTKVAPAGGVAAQGLIPGDLFPTEYINWWMNVAEQWRAYLDAQVDANWAALQNTSQTMALPVNLKTKRYTVQDGFVPTVNGAVDTVMRATNANDNAFITIQGIPPGSIITAIKIRAKAVDAMNPILFQLYGKTFTSSRFGGGGFPADYFSTQGQVTSLTETTVTLSGLNHTMDPALSYDVRVVAGTAGDEFYGIQVVYTEATLRKV